MGKSYLALFSVDGWSVILLCVIIKCMPMQRMLIYTSTIYPQCMSYSNSLLKKFCMNADMKGKVFPKLPEIQMGMDFLWLIGKIRVFTRALSMQNVYGWSSHIRTDRRMSPSHQLTTTSYFPGDIYILWGLDVDIDKTVWWGADAQQRKLLGSPAILTLK